MPEATTVSHPVRYPARVRLRAPAGLPAAIEVAARRRNTSPSNWMRTALLHGLEDQGVRLCDGRVETERR
jgi:hypothetical protein